MKRRRPSLQTVLLTAIAGVAVCAVVVTAGLTIGLGRLSAERTAFAQLRRDAQRLEDLRRNAGGGRREACVPVRRFQGQAVFVPQGRPGPGELQGLGTEGRTTLGGQDLLYTSRAARIGGCPGTLFVFRPAADVEAAPEGVVPRLLLAATLALAVSIGVAYVVSGRLARPLGQLVGAARRMARGERVVLHEGAEPEEVADLRRAFQEMGEELSATRERERSFLLSVSHELRTPLTGIRGYAEALVDGTARGSAKAGSVILGESRRLERLVQDLIDLARLQAGEFSVQPEEVDLAGLVRSVAEAFRRKAEDADVRLQIRSDGETHLLTDPDRAHQMLANLVENALRVTPGGGRISIDVTGRTVVVADSGPGLEPEDLEHTFERFYLWRKYRGERPVGTGLGLAIVGELSRALDVDIAVDSQPGKGTRFTLAFRG